ncbi:MAG TPA: hypothetical protein VNG29_01585 [Candidatus Paceibacterota bacterium]|nr:hypothetical protein [Candidatus Paceibacterota bacterium]
MPGEFGEFRSYRAILDEKKKAIQKRLSDAPPTVVLSRPEGVYLFARELAKIHSTIVLAGAGETFNSIADFFRGRVSDLVLGWGHNVPRADVEGNLLLPAVFHGNLEASGSIAVADIVIVELGNSEEKDYIARVDFLGKVQEFRKRMVVVNYRAKDEPVDEEGDDGADAGDDTVKEGMRPDTREQLAKLNVASPDALEHQDDPKCAREFLNGLKANYPGRKGFLRRDLLQNKSYSWIYEIL